MVKLLDGYVVTADNYGYILGLKCKTNKDGVEKEYMRNISFHSSIKDAINALLKLKIREYAQSKNEVDLVDAITAIDEITKRFEKELDLAFKDKV